MSCYMVAELSGHRHNVQITGSRQRQQMRRTALVRQLEECHSETLARMISVQSVRSSYLLVVNWSLSAGLTSLHNIHCQRRNFGLKSGLPTPKENEVPLGLKTRRGGGWGGGRYPLPSDLVSGGASWALCVGSGQISGRKRFYCNLISADGLCWQQITANSSPFHPEKWVTVPRVHLYSTNYAYVHCI